MTGIEVLLEVLHKAGVRHIFGNPGTTELPLNDALVNDTRFSYIFGLHEIPVMAMADGFAQASGTVSVANVHIACGLGNSMGMLYNAYRAGTPLLLTAGQQDRRLSFDDPVLVGDLVGVTRPWTKWSAEVQRVEDIPNAIRRALQVARTPPTGPVFLALPVDVQMEQAPELDTSPPWVPDRAMRPGSEPLQRAATLLLEAKNPAILAGSRLAESQGQSTLARVAELLGMPVYAENTTAHGRLPMPADHPLYRGPLPLWSPEIRKRLADHDLLLVVGMSLLRLYLYHEPSRPIPEGTRLVHLDNDPDAIGRNFPIEVGLLGDPRVGLEDLHTLLGSAATPRHRAVARERVEASRDIRQREQSELARQFDEQRRQSPITPLTLMTTLARALPADTVVVEEAVTTHQHLLERLGFFKDPSGHIAHRGWALGWGLGCALGVKLAWPDRPVLALLGDGSAMYGIQGLWTAAHHRIPVTFLIANNSQYKILKNCGDQMPLPNMARQQFLAMDLVDPAIDFIALSQSLGVPAERITTADQLADRLADSKKLDGPRLLDVSIAS